MSTIQPDEQLLTEAATFRRLGLPPRKGAKLRAAGVLTPDETIAAGRGQVRLYRADRLTKLAATINPPVAALVGHPESQLPV